MGNQQELDFGDAARLEAHLRRCGVAALAAALAGLVFRAGERRAAGDEEVMVLTISSRHAAGILGASDRAVRKSAATLSRLGWFRIVEVGRGRPPVYVLDVLAARSMPTVPNRLDELLQEPPPTAGPPQVRTTADRCGPSADRCEPVRTGARVLREIQTQNPCFSTHPTHSHSMSDAGPQRSAVVRSGPQPPAGESALPRYPWAREGGVSDAQLVAAVGRDDLRLLRHLFDHAVRLGWIECGGEDAWLRFLTAAHHAATARIARRMGRLVAFVKQGLVVARCAQASDQWAGRMLADSWRDPELVALGRLMDS